MEYAATPVTASGPTDRKQKIFGVGIAALLFVLATTTALCAEPSPVETSPLITTLVDQLRVLPAGTEIQLRLLEPVGSHTHQRGQRFNLEVAQIITVEGQVIVPAGSPAVGEVVHAAKPGMAGKAGELILASRVLRVGNNEIKLRSFVAGNGQDRLSLANGLGLTLGIPALFVVGKNLVLPAGTTVYAKVAADTPLPSILGMKDAVLPLPSVSESSTEIDENENAEE